MEDAHTCRPHGDKLLGTAKSGGGDGDAGDTEDTGASGHVSKTSNVNGSGVRQMLTSPRQTITERARAKCDGKKGKSR